MENIANKHTLINHRIEVGAHGFIELDDFMGDDNAVVRAARTSTGGAIKTPKEDAALIHYLMEHRHDTPFEMCEVKFTVRLPIDVARQWVRHRTFSINEYSGRYAVMIDECDSIGANEWRMQNNVNKQGSDGFLLADIGEKLSAEELALQTYARAVYENRLAAGVSREQARRDLPLCTYTQMVWKGNLRNLLHFLHLRMDAHAQAEIQEFAIKMYEVFVKPLFPVTCDAWENFVRDAVTFSRDEQALIMSLIDVGVTIFPNDKALADIKCRELYKQYGILDENGVVSNRRKAKSFVDRVDKIGIHHYGLLFNYKKV